MTSVTGRHVTAAHDTTPAAEITNKNKSLDPIRTKKNIQNNLSINGRSKAVALLWFSVACFGVRVSWTFHLMCVHIILSSVWVAEWPSFGKKLLTWLTICSFYISAICNIVISRRIWVLIASVPSLCILLLS